MPEAGMRTDDWCTLGWAERRQRLVGSVAAGLENMPGVVSVSIEAGPVGAEYDLTVLVETDVGRMRTPLWSNARAMIFCDASIHPANREQLSPWNAVAEAVDRLRRRLRVSYSLESRGLTLSLNPEDGVVRTWTAEHSLFRKRTAVVREDRVENAGDIDVRNLLAHFYSGPSLRLVSDDGEPFLLPAATEAEGPLVTLCTACRQWSDGGHENCPACGAAAVERVVAARPSRR
jgi:hypothetical protein